MIDMPIPLDEQPSYFSLDLTNLEPFLEPPEILEWLEKAHAAEQTLDNRTGAGNDYLGWLDLPERMSDQLPALIATAESLRELADAIVVIGIGGSYLGARAVIETLTGPRFRAPSVIFAGHQLSTQYLTNLTDWLKDREFALIVISKSGTTTEPAVAFRILRKLLKERYGTGREHADRIVAITDSSKGALRTLADSEGYRSFVVPDDVGGRYSVFTPVGLLPIACAGLDIEELLAGVGRAREDFKSLNVDPTCTYAAIRNLLYQKGRVIEILSNFEPALHYFGEWWKQLYGESEGKDGKGIFPAACDFTTDLHSMGQLIQDGARNIFETFLYVDDPKATPLKIPRTEENLDQLNYLSDAGQTVADINRAAYEGTAEAHTAGGVPNISIRLRELSEPAIGYLMYFFEKACGISGYLLGVNPFNQPGVEAYKSNMFRILGKPK